MADYWKSNPRRMCDVCKVWMADNKVSISMHESGKKHKESVQRRISEARKRGVEEIHEKDEIQRQLAAMERAALSAYKKDIQNDPMLAGTAPLQRQFYGPGPSNGSSGGARHAGSDVEATPAAKEDTADAGGDTGDPAVNATWTAYSTEEGYVYYFNTTTGETTWEKPAGFASSAAPVVVPTAPTVATGQDAGDNETSKADNETEKSVKDVLSSESVVLGEKRKAVTEAVSAWSSSAAVVKSEVDGASDADDDADDVTQDETDNTATGQEANTAADVDAQTEGKVKTEDSCEKKARNARDSAFGSWSTVKISNVTSTRLSGAPGKQGSGSVCVKTEEGDASMKSTVDGDDDDGLGAGLTCRDHEDEENRFKFREKTLSSTIIGDGSAAAPSSSSLGMFKRRKRTGGRRGRNDDD